MYIIKGKDKFNSVDVYGTFKSLKECLNYLNKLKTGCMGNTVRFWYEEKE